MNRAGALAAVLLAGSAAFSCVRKPRTVDGYFPLAVGNAWVYSLHALGAERGLEFEVRGRQEATDGTRYLLDDAGTHYYLRDASGVSVSITPGIWTVLLDGPLTLGRRFDGGRTTGIDLFEAGVPVGNENTALRPIKSSGYKVITAFDRTVVVPAGTFEDCLEVTHVAGPILGVKYFAPGVGLVLGESWTIREDGMRVRTTRQELLWYRIGNETSGNRPAYVGPAAPAGEDAPAGAIGEGNAP